MLPTVIDGVVLPKAPEEILAEKNFNTVPYMVGITKKEFGWTTPMVRTYRTLSGTHRAQSTQSTSLILRALSGHSLQPNLRNCYNVILPWEDSPAWPNCPLGTTALENPLPRHCLSLRSLKISGWEGLWRGQWCRWSDKGHLGSRRS